VYGGFASRARDRLSVHRRARPIEILLSVVLTLMAGSTMPVGDARGEGDAPNLMGVRASWVDGAAEAQDTARVRRPVRAALLVAVALSPGASSPASAAEPRISSASPNPVDRNAEQTVRGRGWPVIEFCSRRVRISLRSDQNAVALGVLRVRTNGRFAFRWTPAEEDVGAGRWRLVARMRCESGDDGSPVIVRRERRIRVRG
jgi:hypothetical protein